MTINLYVSKFQYMKLIFKVWEVKLVMCMHQNVPYWFSSALGDKIKTEIITVD